MCVLYLTEQGAKLGVSEGRFQVSLKNKVIKSIPAEMLSSVELYGNIQVTTQCMTKCLNSGININFYNTYGHYYGNVVASKQINVIRQRGQCSLYDDHNFCLAFAKRVLEAKINNQVVLLRRYSRHSGIDSDNAIYEMNRLRKCVRDAKDCSIQCLIGYEGAAANVYFSVISNLLTDDFKFNKRTRRPAKDPYNTLINIGYSIVHNEIYGQIISKGLNPYFGFIHKDKLSHPTLVSDLIEEWRPILVDSLAIAMLNGNELKTNDFQQKNNDGGIIMKKSGLKKYIQKLENKLNSKQKYLHFIDYPVTFRKAIELQINQLAKAITLKDAYTYYPVRAR